MSESVISAKQVEQLLAGMSVPTAELNADVVENSTQYGLLLDAHGARLPTSVEPLCAKRLSRLLSERARDAWPRREIRSLCPSTNTQLLGEGRDASGRLLTTEFQSSGRGRRGRRWISPIGRNLAISLVWESDGGFESFAGLSLVVGLALVDAVQTLGIRDARLKWPNDLLVPMDREARTAERDVAARASNWGKLCGILVELQQVEDCFLAVIGFGINHGSRALAASAIDQPIADAHEFLPGVSRHEHAAGCINALAENLQAFERDGVEP
ncbi:MAG: biotin--[acetyl-CoA-carboxylase] ligase, partial [Pseudomonadota bacterium]